MNPTILEIRNKGFRITKIRNATVSILSSSTSPLSASDIIKNLYKRDLSANKTTIYRELDFLLIQKFIHEVDFGDGKKRYELNTGKHHHHIVCVNCGNVGDVDFDFAFKTQSEEIEINTGFKIKEHNVEFFGLCHNCQ